MDIMKGFGGKQDRSLFWGVWCWLPIWLRLYCKATRALLEGYPGICAGAHPVIFMGDNRLWRENRGLEAGFFGTLDVARKI